MLIQIPALQNIYDKIYSDALDGKITVAVFIASDCDAIAAARILTVSFIKALLKRDGIQYQLIPVCNYTELQDEFMILEKQGPLLRTVIFLNCGGGCNLTRFWPAEHNVSLYVFDSCRPFLNENVQSEYIYVVDDDLIDVQEPIESEDDEEEAYMPGIKRQRNQSRRGVQKRFKANPDPSGLTFGTSTAGLMYQMAKQRNLHTNDMLWMWLVGLADQYIHRKIDAHAYETSIKDCQEEVKQLNDAPYPTSSKVSENVTLTTSNQDIWNIHIETKDLHLMLYRHWNLYDSMNHCINIAFKLKIWDDPSQQKLKELFAQIGIPLIECRQHFKFMDPVYRETLNTKLTVIARECGLDDLFITSCIRQYDRKSQYSNIDIVHAVTSIVESPTSLEDKDVTESTITVIDSREKWLDNFWIAYDSFKSPQHTKRGVRLAIDLQKAIVQFGRNVLERNAVTTMNNFRYAIINTDIMDQAKYFHHPLALKSLTTFVMEAYHSSRPNRPVLPLVLCISNSSMHSYLIYGLTPSIEDRNDFGWRFYEAATSLSMDFRKDFFEDSFIELPKEHLQTFIEQLSVDGYQYNKLWNYKIYGRSQKRNKDHSDRRLRRRQIQYYVEVYL